MIDNNVLIKIIRRRGHKSDWPLLVRSMISRIGEMKLGFPGLGNNHLELVEYDQIKVGDLFIWDDYLESANREDLAPLMLKKLEDSKALIEGIGKGFDFNRDPDRVLLRWRDIIDLPDYPKKSLVCRVIIKPDLLTGGPGYYYFYKSYRDMRWPTRPSDYK